MPLITITGLCKFVGEEASRRQILKDVSLTVERGEFLAIVGPSGSGKSTLMNMIGCLDTPSSGSYSINGTEVTTLGADELAGLRCRVFGFVFQRYHLLNCLSAGENVTLPGVYAGLDGETRTARAQELLASLKLGEKFRSRPNRLSGGEQQRVSIARALMNGGEIILADEPTGALDSASGKMVMAVLLELNRKGHTVILVTHDRNLAGYANRVIELHDGEIAADSFKRAPVPPTASPAPSAFTRGRIARYKNSLAECLRMSLQAIGAHKLRSMLTMLGIIIGIASVVLVVAMGRGSQAKIMRDISSLGSNTIDVLRGQGRGDRNAWRIKTMTEEDAEVLAGQSYILGATPQVNSSGAATCGSVTAKARVYGVNEQFFGIDGRVLTTGRFYTAEEIKSAASVAVIDEDARRMLFPGGEPPLGRYVFFEKRPLEIVGVMKNSPRNDGGVDSIRLWVPHTTVMYKISGARFIDYITMQVRDGVNAQVAEKNIESILLARHGQKDFYIFNVDTYQKTVESTMNTTAMLIVGIASVSLLVGGIGIMNIMLVSVTERTAEIGLRMAVGASKGNILSQFLLESVTLCLIGCLIGLALAFGLGALIEAVQKDFPLSYSGGSIVLVLCCSSLIGVLFGFIPARNASRLNPIEALARN